MPPHDPITSDHLDPAPPRHRPDGRPGPLRLGVGGPVGCGKTTLVRSVCETLRDELSIAVVTNDIFTTEDADALRRAGALDDDRITAVQTGCCPHTAIRDDIAANLDAVEQLEALHSDLDLVLVESGGDNLTAVFSSGLVDAQVFVLDTAGGDDVPRKGGPGVTVADLLVINKVDLAPLVGADVDRMVADARDRRPAAPTIATSMSTAAGIAPVAEWVRGACAAHR